MYQALYRKYRPRTFDDVVGQEQVTRTLKTQISTGRTSHAYLFIGVRGTGKTTCAKILAKALNCESPEDGNPCNKCKSCLGIESGGVMDVVEIDAASNNGVENVRALREEAVYTPASVKKRVYIIDEVHMLSTSAFNALLKILEEPPEHLVFILATTEIHKVLPTIMSRCQRYSFKRIAPEAIAARLEFVARSEGIGLSPDAAALLSRLADGSLRDGLSLLDQCAGEAEVTSERVLTAMGLAGNHRIAELLGHIISGSTDKAVELFESLWRDGKAPATLLGELLGLLRDVMMLSVAPKGGRELLSGGFDDRTLSELKGKIGPREAMEYIAVIQEHVGSLRDGRDPRIEAELCIIALCEPELLDTNDRLGLRLTRLEKALAEGSLAPRAASGRPAESPAQPSSEDCTEEGAFTNGEALVEDKAPEHTESFAEVEEEYAEEADYTEKDEEPETGGPSEDDEPPFDMPDERPEESFREPEDAPRNVDGDEGWDDPTAPSHRGDDEPSDSSDDPPPAGGRRTADSGLWNELYSRLRGTMPPPMLAHLIGAEGYEENGALVIAVGSEFSKTTLEKPAPIELIRAALSELSGGEKAVKITVKAPDPAAASRLDRLSGFGNVQFE